MRHRDVDRDKKKFVRVAPRTMVCIQGAIMLRANYICCTMSSRAAMQAAFLLVCMASPASCFTQMTNQLQRCKLLASISTRPVCPGRCWRASLDSAGRGSRDRADDPYERLLRERSIGRAFTTKTWLSLPHVFVLLRAGTSGMKIRASHAHPPLPSSHSCWPHLSPCTFVADC